MHSYIARAMMIPKPCSVTKNSELAREKYNSPTGPTPPCSSLCEGSDGHRLEQPMYLLYLTASSTEKDPYPQTKKKKKLHCPADQSEAGRENLEGVRET